MGLEEGDQILVDGRPSYGPVVLEVIKPGLLALSFFDNPTDPLPFNPCYWDNNGVVAMGGVEIKPLKAEIEILKAAKRQRLIEERQERWLSLEPGDFVQDQEGDFEAVLGEVEEGVYSLSFSDDYQVPHPKGPFFYDKEKGLVFDREGKSVSWLGDFRLVRAKEWESWPEKKRELWLSLEPGDILKEIAGLNLGEFSIVLEKNKNGLVLSELTDCQPYILPLKFSPCSYNKKKNVILNKDGEPVPSLNKWFRIERGAGMASAQLYQNRLQITPPSLTVSEEEYAEIMKTHQKEAQLILSVLADRDIPTKSRKIGHILDLLFGSGSYHKEQLVLMCLLISQVNIKITQFTTKKIP
jgi:hypothetical protein